VACMRSSPSIADFLYDWRSSRRRSSSAELTSFPLYLLFPRARPFRYPGLAARALQGKIPCRALHWLRAELAVHFLLFTIIGLQISSNPSERYVSLSRFTVSKIGWQWLSNTAGADIPDFCQGRKHFRPLCQACSKLSLACFRNSSGLNLMPPSPAGQPADWIFLGNPVITVLCDPSGKLLYMCMLRHMLPAQSFSTVSKIHISLYLDIRSPGILEEGGILIRAVIVQSRTSVTVRPISLSQKGQALAIRSQ